jgi:CPA2 family monovalent cation:H+ antiporter-2
MIVEDSNPVAHAIIAGFGVPGRIVAEMLEAQHVRCVVIDTNPNTVKRAAKPGRAMILGDIRDEQILRQAGIDTASLVVIAIPDQTEALEATRKVRELNAMVRIVTRTHFTSAGLEARQLGADEVVVAEQAVAREFARLLSHSFQTS